MRQNKINHIFLIIIIAIGALILLFYPTIKRAVSFINLKKQVSPEVYDIIESRFLNTNSVEKIISLQKSYSYNDSHSCDPELRDDCASYWTSATKEEKKSRYFKYGYLYSEYFYRAEKDYREMLTLLLKTEEFQYYTYLLSCTNPETLNIFFISRDRNKIIDLSLNNENKSQIIDFLATGTVEDIANRSCY